MSATNAARELIDTNRYMTLATADDDGRPWASPVWFAHSDYRELFWVSKPEARHSRNLAERPEVGIVIFDSSVPVGGAQAVYLEATAKELTDADELHRAIETFSRRSIAQGAEEWTSDDVTGSAKLRLYRAISSAQFVLDDEDRRRAVEL
jgi:nitroimidazol reductase NimA-like FMN-containing flavoprotein (pyridoxamine 5'-phosphate oxidase superfamily)